MNTAAASYDLVNNRVALDVTHNPEITCLTVWRVDEHGFIKAIPSLTHIPVPLSKICRLFDYAAPLNRTSNYKVVYYSGGALVAEAITECSVFPSDNRHWLKKPPGAAPLDPGVSGEVTE